MYEEICEQNKGLVVSMARRYARACALDRAVSKEDLIQSGYLALMRAAQTYDPAAGKTWAAWATWHIRKEFHAALGLREGHFHRAHTGAVPLDQAVLSDDDGETTLLDTLADETNPAADEALLREELRREVRQAVERLKKEDQRQAVRLCRLEGRSYREAGADMGIPAQRALKLCQLGEIHLAQDWRLRRLADLDEHTRFYAHKGVAAFNRDWTSVTEGAALWRIAQRDAAGEEGAP